MPHIDFVQLLIISLMSCLKKEIDLQESITWFFQMPMDFVKISWFAYSINYNNIY